MPGASTDDVTDSAGFYGMATITKYDADGDPVSTQSVHNRLLDTGEIYLLRNTFDNNQSVIADGDQVGSICIADRISVTENLSAANFNGANGITEANCRQDTDVDIANGVATIGPLRFTAGTHLGAGETISGIGICKNKAANNDDYSNCTAPIFAAISITNVTLATGETADITYKFDISSADT